jgi:hypothetical protein
MAKTSLEFKDIMSVDCRGLRRKWGDDSLWRSLVTKWGMVVAEVKKGESRAGPSGSRP